MSFKIKHESIEEFFTEYRAGSACNGSINLRDSKNQFTDELFIKKGLKIEIDNVVEFELKDRSNMSQKDLTNTYVYLAESYDDISLKLVLKDFTISLEE